MANIYSLQLLRNGSAYATKAAAIEALSGATALSSINKKDGVAVLARYVDGSSNLRTLVGYYANASEMTSAGGGNSYMTIFDIEGASADIQEIKDILGTGVTTANTVTEQLQALSGSTADTSASTSVVGAKAYADEILDEALDALDASSVSGASKVVIDVTQADGAITATAANLTGVKLDGLTAGTDADIAATDTLGEALANLQAQINAMDLSVVSGAGEVITSVSEADGKVSATTTAIKDVLLTGYVKDTTKTGALAATDDIEDALSKLENNIAAAQNATTLYNSDSALTITTATTGTTVNVNIKSGEQVLAKGNDGLYTDIKLTKTTGNTLPEEIKERYTLVGTDNNQLGSVTIDIPKDSHIVSIDYLPTGETGGAHAQSLKYTYIDVSGNTQSTYVDMSELILEQEFASGVTVTDHIAHGVVDPTSEAFLTVGANGFKLSGVQDAIDDAVEDLDASVTGGTTAGTATSNHVQVVVDEVDGKLTAVTVTETNIADKSALDALSAKTVTEITSSNSSIAVDNDTADDGTVTVDLVTDASKILMSGFTAAASGLTGITEDDSVTDAVKEIETQMLANERVTSAALADLDARIREISGSSISGLDAEIAARKAVDGINGSAYTANTSAHYISTATSLNNADQLLDTALYKVSTALTAEIAAREAVDGISGTGYTPNTSANYISTATSLNNADVLLDAAIKAVSDVADAAMSGATMNGTAVTATSNVLTFTAVASSGATESNDAIVIDTDANGGLTFSLGTLDAGVY